jgi:pyruvate kinase
MNPLLPKDVSKTKVIATIGPSSWDEQVFMSMVEAGMDIARINASFADEPEIRRVTAMVRRLAPRVAVLLDTHGHKVRLNDIGENRQISSGDRLSLFTQPTNSGMFLVTESQVNLEQQIPVGSIILIDDGTIKLNVAEIRGTELVCDVIQGGELKRMKTVSIPGVSLDFGGLSENDRQVIILAKELGIDIIAASFVRTADNVREIRGLLEGSSIALVSKIEDQQGVEHFKSILELSDGIMIARGDLSLDVLPERVPALQKHFIKECNAMAKPVVVATQMLESMVNSVTPTRAEVSDVANAVYDGADAVMLSAETSVGKYPVEAVAMMGRIAHEIELTLEPRDCPPSPSAKPTTNAIAKAVYESCLQLPIDKVLVATGSGCTAQTISRFWLKQPVFAFTHDHTAEMRLMLSRGIVPDVITETSANASAGVKAMVSLARDRGYVDDDDLVVVVAGANVIAQGGTNMLEINNVAHIISH